MNSTLAPAHEKTLNSSLWLAAALVLTLIFAVSLRYGTTNPTLDQSVRDEDLMKVPIDNILRQGWSAETALDYQEVKGPAFYWTYAILGTVVGSELSQLRWVSLGLYIGAVLPLLLIARQVGAKGPALILIAGLYTLLPYNAWMGQLLFSEPSFNFFGMWLVWAFVWTFGSTRAEMRPLLGPVLVAALLCVLLHHRPHAVAFAAAIGAVAFTRDRFRAWPWFAACAVAGVLRMPLWLRWGGLVTSDYQGIFGFGIRPAGLTYMIAALVPWLAIFLWPVAADRSHRRAWKWVGAAFAFGLIIGLIAQPDLLRKIGENLPAGVSPQREFAGVVATVATKIAADASVIQSVIVAVLAALGAASLTAFGWLAWTATPKGMASTVIQTAFWTVCAGVPLYVMTNGPVYDRYLVVWTILLPICWWRLLSSRALIALILVLALMFGWFTYQNLLISPT